MATLTHIFRWICTGLILVQVALPYAQAKAADQGINLADLICNPSGQPVSQYAATAMSDLLSLLEEDENSEVMLDCDHCVSPHETGLVPPANSSPLRFDRRILQDRPRSENLGPISPRGPPCGLRAPPAFV